MQAAGRQICRNSPHQSDELIDLYRQSGRAEDFEQIVRRFAALVLCECRRVTRNMSDAEDASQLVFLALAMEIKSGTVIQRPTAWLKRVSHRQALKIVRSRGRRQRRENAARRSELHHVDIDSPLDSPVTAAIVRDAIDQLPERYRLPLVLHYFGGMSLEQIAHELKANRQTVGTRLHRARKMLHTQLNSHGVKLNEFALGSLLALLVPAAVVESVMRSAMPMHANTAVLTLPGNVTGMLHAAATVTMHRPLRLASLAAAFTFGGTALAWVARVGDSLPAINSSNAMRWIDKLFSFRLKLTLNDASHEGGGKTSLSVDHSRIVVLPPDHFAQAVADGTTIDGLNTNLLQNFWPSTWNGAGLTPSSTRIVASGAVELPFDSGATSTQPTPGNFTFLAALSGSHGTGQPNQSHHRIFDPPPDSVVTSDSAGTDLPSMNSWSSGSNRLGPTVGSYVVAQNSVTATVSNDTFPAMSPANSDQLAAANSFTPLAGNIAIAGTVPGNPTTTGNLAAPVSFPDQGAGLATPPGRVMTGAGLNGASDPADTLAPIIPEPAVVMPLAALSLLAIRRRRKWSSCAD